MKFYSNNHKDTMDITEELRVLYPNNVISSGNMPDGQFMVEIDDLDIDPESQEAQDIQALIDNKLPEDQAMAWKELRRQRDQKLEDFIDKQAKYKMWADTGAKYWSKEGEDDVFVDPQDESWTEYLAESAWTDEKTNKCGYYRMQLKSVPQVIQADIDDESKPEITSILDVDFNDYWPEEPVL